MTCRIIRTILDPSDVCELLFDGSAYIFEVVSAIRSEATATALETRRIKPSGELTRRRAGRFFREGALSHSVTKAQRVLPRAWEIFCAGYVGASYGD